ncbi:MAG: HEAT repeat domain-containing protein [Deltaproteobacteria bacterium]|nr:HEAT repeat domain-containing protein [Deltaproteobacteria bacterium]
MAMTRTTLVLALTLAGCASGPTPVQVRQMGQRGDTAGLFEAWESASKDKVRVAVLEAFAQNPSDAAGQRLVVKQAREATSRPVQLAALRALAAYQGDDVVGALVPALGHPWPEAREVARANLAAQGPRAHAALLAAVGSDANPWVRAGATKLLVQGALTHAPVRPAVEDALLARARDDQIATVREAAVVGLGALKVAAARPVLGELARTDPDTQVRLQADQALRSLGEVSAEEEVVVAVLPLKDDTGGADPEAARLGMQVAEYVAARLSETRVCKVVDRAKLEAALEEMRKVGKHVYDGDAPNVPEIGAFKLANQLVYGSVQRQGGTYTVVLNRMQVSTLELVPGAAVTVRGYRADLDKLKVEAADRFVKRFR